MWRTIGHERALSTLQRGLGKGLLSHAYLLTGPRQVGKMTLALDVARAVNCRAESRPCDECAQCRRIAHGLHADVRVMSLESQEGGDGRRRVAIGIDQVREMQREASLKPYEGGCRVFILDGAERLSEEAANSLLKILEEPPEQVILVLLALEAGQLLPTIVSRCQHLELRPLPFAVIARELESRGAADQGQAQEIARLSGGRLGWALEALRQPAVLTRRAEMLASIEDTVRGGVERRFAHAARLAASYGQSREPLRQEMALWLEWWRDLLLIKEGVPDLVTNLSRGDALKALAEVFSSAQIVSAIKAIQSALDYLERNVNPRLALEDLMLALPQP